MFEKIRIFFANKKQSAHIRELKNKGCIGLDNQGKYGIFEASFMSYVSENVSPNDIENFLDAVVEHVQIERMAKILEAQRHDLVREKIKDLIVINGE